MEIDPRAALDRLIEALNAHYESALHAQDPESPAVISATVTLEDAFITYDDALMTHYDVDLPFDLFDDDDEDEDEIDADEFGDVD
ncbi:MAG: DNA primase [Ruaniaceae bacterium]|nr:DNA primase [Ruaniaceae bacterium]